VCVWARGVTHHLAGAVRGLYLRYFFLHSTTATQWAHMPEMGMRRISCVFFECLLCRKAVVFWCAGGPFLPPLGRLLIVRHTAASATWRPRRPTRNVYCTLEVA
jgi:hypothetical protein